MTKKLTTAGVMLALAIVLSQIKVFDAPYGGSVTAASMLPVLIIAILYDVKWGLLGGLIFAALQMLFGGIPAPPVTNAFSYILVVLLDYVLAFGVLGLAGVFYRHIFKGKTWGIGGVAALCIFLRFLCHFLSGILIWDVYAWEGYGAAMYSFLYNGSYMLFELIITTLAAAALSATIQKQIKF